MDVKYQEAWNMKTRCAIVYLLIFAALFLSFSTLAIAQGGNDPGEQKEEFLNQLALAKSMKLEGTVLSHDVRCHCFVVKTDKGELTLQDDYVKFMDEYDRAKGLKIGKKVKGDYKTVDFINYAINLSYVE